MQGRISNGKNEIAIQMIGNHLLLLLLLKCPLGYHYYYYWGLILVVGMIIRLIKIGNKLQFV